MDQISPGYRALLGRGQAYEDIILRLYRALLRPGDLALDGGAGRGRDSFAMARLVGPTGRLIACEPIPWLAERLQLDARLRNLPQVEVRPAALAERSGEAPFHWIRNADPYSALQPRPYGFTPETDLIRVPLARIDDLLEGETRPWRFAKLDLQGGDVPALLGAERAIASHRPALVFHNSRAVAAAAHGYAAEAVFDLFNRLGYRLLDLFGRPFTMADWDAPGIPWYSIAVPQGTELEARVELLIGPIIEDVARRVEDPGIEALEPWLRTLPPSEYLATHWRRYQETWRRAAPALMPAYDVVELGGLSTIGTFLQQQRGVELRQIASDLRYPYPALDESADAVLSLEVLEHLNEAHNPSSSIEEIAVFLQSGAANMFREAYRILRPGGCLVLTTPNITSLDSIGNLLRRRHAFNYPPHVREYAPADVIALAETAGFVTEAAETFTAWHSHPDIDREALAQGLAAMGFDMTGRGDDAYFLFRRPG